MGSGGRTLKTTRTSLEILDLLGELDGAGVTRIAEELDRPPSTVHGHLATLEEGEFVVADGDVYRLGLKFLALGRRVENSKPVYRRADAYTEKAARETECRSVFAVEEHGWGVFVSRNAGEFASWEREMVGERCYLHATAVGKAILGHLSGERRDEIFEKRGLPRLTDNTITDRVELEAELETVRERGVAFDREEELAGVVAVSAPVVDDGRVVGALGVNAPAEQVGDDRFESELPGLVRGIADEFRLDLELGETPQN